jgi:hypothetical protein
VTVVVWLNDDDYEDADADDADAEEEKKR